MSLTAIILAAGKSTRMKSKRPKALHEVCGKPMLHYILQACYDAGVTRALVVVGYGKVGAHQYSQGQGHAVLAATQPLWCVTDQWSLLGAGVAVRAGRAAVKDFDDFGVAIPLATYRRGRFVAQVGSEIQTLRYKKTFFYLALGVTLRRWPVRPAASP